MTRAKAFSTVAVLFAASVLAAGCHSGPMRTTYPPKADIFAKIEAGAQKVGWKVERLDANGTALMIYPPNDEMKVDTAPEISTSSMPAPAGVGVKCRSNDWDACKRYFDQVTMAAGLGPATYQ